MSPKSVQTRHEQEIDPELSRQLETAAAGGETVEAVIRLRAEATDAVVPTPERTEALTHAVIRRISKKSGTASELQYNIFRNLGSFVVAGPPELIREVIGQPEVAAAVANRQPSSAFIPPVQKAPLRATKSPARKRRK